MKQGAARALLVVLLAAAPLVSGAAERAELPVLPLLAHYTRWDHHLLQWLPDHPRYEMAEAFINARPDQEPLIWVLLTERRPRKGSKPQVGYTNSADWARQVANPRSDSRSRATDIRLTMSPEGSSPSFVVELVGEEGPFRWEFESQGQPSEKRGQGLINVAESAHNLRGGLLVLHLPRCAVSARSTCLTLGERSCEVKPWDEISFRPFFYGYRGVYSTGANVGYLPAVAFRTTEAGDKELPLLDLSWQSYPAEDGSGETVFEAPHMAMRASSSGEGSRIESVAAVDGQHEMRVRFSPALPDLAGAADGQWRSTWTVGLPDTPEVLSGLVAVEKSGEGVSLLYEPREPKWARELGLEVEIRLLEDGYTYRAQSIFPGRREGEAEQPGREGRPG